ncbi:hypothetical protein Slin_0405 [Spirosoma linguale DSM 74]|uniref:Uncharacterized protein n=1 Tax=Spirosoma linguale (strain ATCC 33905 / DSM 74 / LMG 10896 / Claus 1) TaxID=504472 RepID=D2QEB4_SPILD|nr:hypothetical protein Slin_0405 [Spirosoma linguale DSM 74]
MARGWRLVSVIDRSQVETQNIKSTSVIYVIVGMIAGPRTIKKNSIENSEINNPVWIYNPPTRKR